MMFDAVGIYCIQYANVLQTLSDEESKRYQLENKTIKHDLYVDDKQTGFDDTPTALICLDQLRKMMNFEGFELNKMYF